MPSRNESPAIRLARIDANKCTGATMLAGTVPIDVLQLVLSHGIESKRFDGETPPFSQQTVITRRGKQPQLRHGRSKASPCRKKR